jgi:hypothetical protein
MRLRVDARRAYLPEVGFPEGLLPFGLDILKTGPPATGGQRKDDWLDRVDSYEWKHWH